MFPPVRVDEVSKHPCAENKEGETQVGSSGCPQNSLRIQTPLEPSILCAYSLASQVISEIQHRSTRNLIQTQNSRRVLSRMTRRFTLLVKYSWEPCLNYDSGLRTELQLG